jgi:putative glutathione S-transferase
MAAHRKDVAMAGPDPQGAYRRDQDYVTTRITADGRDGYPVEPGR